MSASLASYQRCLERIRTGWPTFRANRTARLAEAERHGTAPEKVAENILEDLFTNVLDWTLDDLDHQVGYADLLLTQMAIKYLLVEVKRPGALVWNERAVRSALNQARRYADEQRVMSVAVSDGVMLYAGDIKAGNLIDRALVRLDGPEPDPGLWWLSVHGIYRPPPDGNRLGFDVPPVPVAAAAIASAAPGTDVLLHPKYHLPESCFAYVGNASDPHTWKLPYRHADDSVDRKRLPKAVQAILSNYRGEKVEGIPYAAIAGVLRNLSEAARSVGRMPDQCATTAPVYQQLAEVLRQFDSGER
jgi:hypothetical protein